MSPNLYPPQEQYPQLKEEQKRQTELERESQVEAESEHETDQKQEAKQPAVQETDYGRVTAPAPVSHTQEPQPLGDDVKTQELMQIENILSEHIDALYQSLPEAQRPLFKEKGEEAAQKIDSILRGAKIQARKILAIIISWLSIIPGVNKFFIEQQAEIKTNKLLALHDKQRPV